MKENHNFKIDVEEDKVLRVHAIYDRAKLEEALEDLVYVDKLKAAKIQPTERNDAIMAILVTHMGSLYKCFVLERNSSNLSNRPVESVVWTFPFISLTEEVDPTQLQLDLETTFPNERLLEVETWKCKTFGFDRILSLVELE
jgi:hypothetical protein